MGEFGTMEAAFFTLSVSGGHVSEMAEYISNIGTP